MDALSAEIKSLLTGPLKGKRTGVGELRKKMEAQSDVQVSYVESVVVVAVGSGSIIAVAVVAGTAATDDSRPKLSRRGKHRRKLHQAPLSKYSGKTSKRKA